MKFKLNDRVKLNKNSIYYNNGEDQLNDHIGIISEVFGSYLSVTWLTHMGIQKRNVYEHEDLFLYSANISNNLKKKK